MATTYAKNASHALAGEVAKDLGIGVQTLHFYERERLIPRPPRSEGGYRLFSPEVVDRVRFIRKAQSLGLPLEEIREILTLSEQGARPCARVQAGLRRKLVEIDQRLEELREFRRDLSALLEFGPDQAIRSARDTICSIVEEAPQRKSSLPTRMSSEKSGIRKKATKRH